MSGNEQISTVIIQEDVISVKLLGNNGLVHVEIGLIKW